MDQLTRVFRRRPFLTAAVASSAALLLAACGQSAAPSQPEKQSQNPAASASPAPNAAQGTVPAQVKPGSAKGTVSAWYVFAGDSTPGKTMPQIAASFNKSQPGLTVNVQFGGATRSVPRFPIVAS